MGRRVMGLPVVGSVDDLEEAIRARRASVVVVSTLKVGEDRLALARAACSRCGARFVRMQIRFDDYDLAVVGSKTTPGVVSAAGPSPSGDTLTLHPLAHPAGDALRGEATV